MTTNVKSGPLPTGPLNLSFDAQLFTNPAPAVTEDEAERFLKDIYNLNAEASALFSERDTNFLVKTENGNYILKITNAAESAEHTEFNTAIFEYLQRHAPELPVPRIVHTYSGHLFERLPFGENNIARLLTYLEGVPLTNVDISKRPFEGFGRFLGHLDRALSTFEHPSMHFDLAWNSAALEQLATLVDHIPDATQRALVSKCLAEFMQDTAHRLNRVRHQIIHNDANLGNTLTALGDPSTICGLFDFGDVVYAPVINELAVAASYNLTDPSSVQTHLIQLVRGFHSQYALTIEDIELLPALIQARLITTVLITHWRAALFPEKNAYILRNTSISWSGLQSLSKVDFSELTTSLRQACVLEA